MHRIWSTDWFYNPRGETLRLREFLDTRRRLSSLESPATWENNSDDGYVEEDENIAANEVANEVAETIAAESDGSEDMFVEVADRVTYCALDDPNTKHSVLIVDSPSNVKMGLVNEEAPLAQALLGLSPGDNGILEIPGHKARNLRVMKIQRQEAEVSTRQSATI